ncbi:MULTISPECIES: hypothetical protein [unclassified Streptomyces]|uniref:4'-phosphopantetheinyl transferase family protein n=1 Tax=unclassified Streptomyces TaxID=2593676 RepID=UPI001FD56C9C|nr:hypothetical protein [Streptomyces sp. So13.3]
MPGAAEPVPPLGGGVTLDPARPLQLRHARGPLTLAVVSIAWLRSQGEDTHSALSERHLCAEEIAHAATLPLAKRRIEWLAGRLAIKHGVCAYRQRSAGFSMRTADVRVRAVENGVRAGKPVVNVPVEVGLSHSADFAIAACGPREIGIDLERSRAMSPLLEDLLAFDTDSRGAHGGGRLQRMPVPLRWACKEAVLKHFGVGLRVDSREVVLTGWRADGRFSWTASPELRRRIPDAAGPHFESWAREIDGYALAMVWRQEP